MSKIFLPFLAIWEIKYHGPVMCICYAFIEHIKTSISYELVDQDRIHIKYENNIDYGI